MLVGDHSSGGDSEQQSEGGSDEERRHVIASLLPMPEAVMLAGNAHASSSNADRQRKRQTALLDYSTRARNVRALHYTTP